MSFYLVLKYLHVSTVVLSGAGFLLRGCWMLVQSPLLAHPITRRLPHVIDSLLLLSAIGLAVMMQQFPFVAPWVTAKVLGLIGYIVLGTIALKRGRSLRIRAAALLLAIAVYAWIVSVALLKTPQGFWSLLAI